MNPLQNLKDIHVPDAIESWPPAYGWWLLLLVFATILVAIVIYAIKTRQKRVAKRQAMLALKQIDPNNAQAIAQCNQILKRVAIYYFPAQQIQKMFGTKWLHFLVSTLPNKRAKQLNSSLALMQEVLYQKQKTDDVIEYQKACEAWVKYALPPRTKTLSQLEQSHA